MVAWVGGTSAGSDERKSHMLKLKSAIATHGCPILFLTINPADLHSPMALFYAGTEINVKDFHPERYDSTMRLKTMLNNPLAVVEYFHTTLTTIIETVLKGGIFGELNHYYATIEYQGRATPHAHMAVHPS
jgi:Helitron helicase-like domain at N-terminus